MTVVRMKPGIEWTIDVSHVLEYNDAAKLCFLKFLHISYI
jgi:hypothetical protein